MATKKPTSTDEMLEQVIQNAQEDRAKAKELLEDLLKGITMPDMHVTHGDIAQKYLGKMNKSTDQILRAFEIMKKAESAVDSSVDFKSILDEESDFEKLLADDKSKDEAKKKASEKVEEPDPKADLKDEKKTDASNENASEELSSILEDTEGDMDHD